MSNIQILNPDSLGKPLGQYSQLTRVKASEFLFIAGQVGADVLHAWAKEVAVGHVRTPIVQDPIAGTESEFAS